MANLIFAKAFRDQENRLVAALVFSDGTLGTFHDDTRPPDAKGNMFLGNFRGGSGEISDPNVRIAFKNYRNWVDSNRLPRSASLDILPNSVR